MLELLLIAQQGFKLNLVLTIFGIVLLIIGPLVWSVQRVLRPVDRAARARNLPFRFSMGDFLCLFWIVQVPLAFVYQLGSNGNVKSSDSELREFYWILTAVVWIIAPLAWYTVAKALSKAGVQAGLHRMIFLGVVLPAVYYGLFPFIGMSIAILTGLNMKGAEYAAQNKTMLGLWCVVGAALLACGFYSPWMVSRAEMNLLDYMDSGDLESLDDVELTPVVHGKARD